MKIILIQKIVYISNKETKVREYTNKFHSNIKPDIDDIIELPAFNSHRQFSKVQQVYLKFNQNECQVILEDLITNTFSDVEEYNHTLINDGWSEEQLY